MSRASFTTIIRQTLRAFRAQQSSGVSKILGRPTDLPSIKEFIRPHADNVERGVGMKGMFTSDPKTIDIGRRVLRKAGNSSESSLSFFEEKIFSQPDHSTKEAGSIKIKVSDVRDIPEFRRKYFAKRNQNVMLCIGGPAAEDQTVMASIVSAIREKLDEIIYLTRDYKESNVNHAAKQSHARHGNALNADKALTGHALLPQLLLRKILGIDPLDTLDPNFTKIDVEFTLDPKKLRIYFANELNWLKQEYKKRNGELTEHDINRIESILSQEILKIVEQQANISLSGRINDSIDNSSSVHVVFDEKSREQVQHENEDFLKVGIKSKELDEQEMKEFFSDSKDAHSAWKYQGDTHLKFDAHDVNRNAATLNQVQWIEGLEVDRILLIPDENGNARCAGVSTTDGQYFYANKLHFTGGYKAALEFDRGSEVRFSSGSFARNLLNKLEDIFNLQTPITNSITTSTGVSINAIFKRSDRINNLIKKYGSTGEIAVTNSHWTMIAHDKDYVVMRITGGGNTGSEEYNPSYFLNVISNTRRLFGDELVGILSTYGCPRAINARNSTEFATIAQGAIVSYGKGGTGNTKRHAEGALGLMMLGFDKEIIEYFNKFQGRDGKMVGDKLKEVYEHIEGVEFLHDNTKKTNRRMGYDKSISFEEAALIILLVGAVAYAISKTIDKEKKKEESIEEKKPEETTNTSIKATNTTRVSTQQNQL